MFLANIDQFIIYFYLIAMLAFGVFAGRNIKGMKDFAIANRTYSTPVMAITFLATIFGGTSTIGMAESVHQHGIIMIVATSGYIISYLFIARFIAPKMGRFDGMISVGDIMHKFYGRNGKIITGVLGFLFCTAIVAAQCRAIGYLLNATFGFSEEYAILIGATVLVLYSTFGGIKSVTITDVLQFGILIVVVPLIANISVTDIGGVNKLIESVPDEKFLVFSHNQFWEFFTIFIVWGVFPSFLLSPAPIQRMLMASDVKIISKMYYMGALMTIPFEIMVMLLGFAAIVLFPEVQSGLALPEIINTTLPPIIKGLAITGVLAVVMSTADSFLNSGAILLVHDVLKPSLKNVKLPELKLTRFTTFAIGIFAMYIAVNAVSIISLEVYAVSLWGPIVVIPLAAAILNYSSTPKAFAYTTICTVATFAALTIFMPSDLGYWSGLICIIANAVFFFYFSERFTKASKKNNEDVIQQESINDFIEKFKSSFSELMQLDLVTHIDSKIKRIGSSHIFFGIFCCFNYIVPYFMWTQGTVHHYELLIMIRLISGCLCVGLLIEAFWPKQLKRYFGIYWYVTLCFCLPFTTTVSAVIQSYEVEWIVNMSLAVFLLALLVDWLSFVILSLLGTVLGYVFCRIVLDDFELYHVAFENFPLAVYIIFFSSIIGLIFSRRRDNYVDEKINFLQKMSGMIAHEVKTPLTGVNSVREMFDDILKASKADTNKDKVTIELKKSDYKMLTQIPELLQKSVEKGHIFIETFVTEMKEEVPEAEKNDISLKLALKDAIENFHLTKKHKGKIDVKIKGDCKIFASERFTMHVFLNLLLNAVNHCGAEVHLTVSLKNNIVTIRDNGQGIDQGSLPFIFDKGFSTSNSSGLGLSFCKMVMKNQGGEIVCKSKKSEFTEFKLKFLPIG